ncbi:MAG: glycosyltransferase family protein [Bacteroidaceae bacterium]|nr:glycosyltransferase family protein [Dysgonamonadaceae bacterium]MDD3309711.1 glycosyltransferase family protein [Dysgonamonadaceae bacterium]MDD3900772.1 glycosyltransferase family protein [Dysgonamonadaceae bacterium]MDD4399459.1 glycosyltransferase family protein [Dysgonamonadaceae bacterium]MEA5081307.1 glycosyltransferase family protein [Dysgonamonadaceae bacterium]
MRFLFTVQGEGRGHFTQALSLAYLLRKHGHEVSAVLVGKSDSREIPKFFLEKIGAPVFVFNSPNFTTLYKNKRPNIFATVLDNAVHSMYFRKSIQFVKDKILEYKPDAVINFYELITGMAFAYYKFDDKQGIKFICVGHHYVLLNPNYKTSTEQDVKYYFLRMLSKATCQRATKLLALSFRDMPGSKEKRIVVVPPLLRREVFEVEPTQGNYIHGYMLNTGYYDEVMDWHMKHPEIPLRFFWDKKGADDVTVIDDNLILYRLNDTLFLKSMAGSMAYSTTSGFESVCEALYYQKPILMIPVHVEQEFNAYDAGLSGAGISSNNFELSKLIDFIPNYQPDKHFRDWVHQAEDLFIKEICED